MINHRLTKKCFVVTHVAYKLHQIFRIELVEDRLQDLLNFSVPKMGTTCLFGFGSME